MTPEQKAREVIDRKLQAAGWIARSVTVHEYFSGQLVAQDPNAA